MSLPPPRKMESLSEGGAPWPVLTSSVQIQLQDRGSDARRSGRQPLPCKQRYRLVLVSIQEKNTWLNFRKKMHRILIFVGGLLIDLEGRIVGMNFIDENRTPFLPVQIVGRCLKHFRNLGHFFPVYGTIA
ncbi:uncharacterized protein LOC125523702 isoform X2 [Triticum urartu]|uniref:uncharacterized protein LOC125523702 isoform X2 n=1 Tax=Triticum urartu TaxID=4572 RepID=UPI0020432B31|nr:uncharacterized protein LOC125523702 isoform X2 [Triticum urartu]